ncbi:aminotransferase class I/II-fold pyridoxal phosphate-dependent enzyme [Aquibacillus halophilus]|uniref:homocysteine desulfhydrase n=1 Tax=Aquibacillus halophilus TaxID=930132 RepID=A0A6A8DEG4_9BACI|nr:aminotransferase class I/II-fold pyridoxal phosphate-dependent enzyme [Aquibacillus halophilus]MRH44088.1 aminotransferase class I/II-fold pyridoxal phosphate-dependent enzyme [Aquibacillus halophilus]
MGQKFDTKSVHLALKDTNSIDSKVTPIYQTSAFKFSDLEDLENFYNGKKDYLYSRVGNPNTDELGGAVAQLEGAPKGVATSSGLSAILVGVLAVAKAGDHIIASNDIYGGTYQLLANELVDFGIEVSFVDFEKVSEVENHIKENTKLIYSESITNPLLRVESLDEVVRIAKEHNLYSMIDNTFATPYLCQPYSSGIDLVVHSATKYLGGHSDVTAGVLVGKEELINKAKGKVVNIGTNLSPFDAWLACRGIKTLSVRMERHVRNAQALADALRKNTGVDKVYYPTSVSTKGNGAIVSIDITGLCNIEKFFKSLSWVKIVPTLAGVETSVSYPLTTSHRALPKESQIELGITEGLVRISVGIEDAEDIINAFEKAIHESIL